MRVIVIIPARGGSKRLPRKNIYPIWNKPMIHWSIKAAKDSKHVDEVWVTTEDAEIAKIAVGCGASLHRRDPKLSEDKVYKMEAIRSAVSYLEDNDSGANIYISLQANSPEITTDMLDSAIEEFIKNDRNEIISVSPNLMQNAAFRILKRGYVFERDLSTKCGVFVCDVHDVHSIEDVTLIEARNQKM
jgi:CMP-N,N'-diacetyllegionaminic acid synthase